jgi:purine-nucleoside/S-methyl-5'-thioadenosine phosphorylase / adenosine deaminase
MEITWLTVPEWESYPGLLHGFVGRRGGRSVGPYAGLNVSLRVGDEPDAVKNNICDLKHAVGIHDGRIVTMNQVHGDGIVEVNDKTRKETGEADAMVTHERGTYLGILTADCVPILLAAPKRKMVAVVHAGWRGTLAGLAAKVVRLLQERYEIATAGIEAALGPSIGGCCYEIKDDVARPLLAQWGSRAESSLERRDGKCFLDLRRLNREILAHAGISASRIFEVGPCTSCASEEFFSYRREGADVGRQLSFIGWLPSHT